MRAAGPAGHYAIGDATDLYFLGFYPVTLGLYYGTVQHPTAGVGGGNINHSWIQQQYHLQHHRPAHLRGH